MKYQLFCISSVCVVMHIRYQYIIRLLAASALALFGHSELVNMDQISLLLPT